MKSKSPGRPRSVESHQAILQATLELLAEVGFDRMSMDAIARCAKVGKTTIYRRYSNKEELVADAIESIREEIIIPDTGTLEGDLKMIIQNAARITFNPLGRQAVMMIVNGATSNSQFAEIYRTKYLQPRREAFSVVIERAKARGEVKDDLDAPLVFDTISGIMFYALIFPPQDESWQDYVCRALKMFLDTSS